MRENVNPPRHHAKVGLGHTILGMSLAHGHLAHGASARGKPQRAVG